MASLPSLEEENKVRNQDHTGKDIMIQGKGLTCPICSQPAVHSPAMPGLSHHLLYLSLKQGLGRKEVEPGPQAYMGRSLRGTGMPAEKSAGQLWERLEAKC